MTLQWMAVSLFLYGEIVLTFLLIIPILKPSMWKKLFSISLFSSWKPFWTTTFYAILVTLIFLFIDSIRQMRKYSAPDPSTVTSFDSKMDRLYKECRGQRNFYITGFALFLIIVIKRLISIIYQHASLNANYEALLRQANRANEELSKQLDKSSPMSDVISKKEYETLQNELQKSKTDLEILKKQTESSNAEYDRLSSEYQKLQNSEAKKKDD